MRVFTFCVGGSRANGPVDFGPCRAGTSTSVEVLFTSGLSVSVNVSISNIPRNIDAVPRQFVLNQSSKVPIKLTWTSKETKFQVLNENLNIEIQKSVQRLTLLGLATEKELSIFLSSSNEKLYHRILSRPETFFQSSPIFDDTASGDTFIGKHAPNQKSTDQFSLLQDRSIYDKMMTHGSYILNNFTNSLLHTAYIAGYEIFQRSFLTKVLPGLLIAAQKKYNIAIPAIRRKVTFRGDISSPLDQQCRSMLIPALETIDGSIFRLACDCLYRPRFELSSLLGLPQLNMAEVLLESEQAEIIKQIFYGGLTGLANRAFTIEDQKKNRIMNCNLFIRIICIVDLCIMIYKASGILRPLQRHIEITLSNGKQANIKQVRTLTEFINSYYSIIGATGGLSAILNDLGFTWFNPNAEQSHPVAPIMAPIRSENIANFRTLLPHLLLYISHEKDYKLKALTIPTGTYEEIINNMKVFLLFCWPNTLMLEASKGVNRTLSTLPILTNTNLNHIILTIIKENQMAGLLCSEKLFLACINSTTETSMINILCQQLYTRLERVFDPSNSPVVRAIDRMYDEFKHKQEEMTRSTIMLSNANVLDTLISGLKIDSSSSKRKHRTLLATLKRHLTAQQYSEFLLLALQMIALLHGYDLNNTIFEARDCVNNGLLLIMIARTILPTGQRIFPGKSLWKFSTSSSTCSSLVRSVNDNSCDDSELNSDIEEELGCSMTEGRFPNLSNQIHITKSGLDHSSYVRSTPLTSDKKLTISQMVAQQQERDGYIKPNHSVLRLSDFYSCHLAYVDALEIYGKLFQMWDYSLYIELFKSRFSILRVLPNFVYHDNTHEHTRYSFSLFKLVNAYTRSMGSLLPNTSMLSYYISILFVTVLVSNDYCLTDQLKLELLNITPEERDYRNLLNKYAKSMERYRVRMRVDRRIATVQAFSRGFLVRQYYRKIKYSALVIQHMWRTKLYQIEKGYLLTAQARRNLYLRGLLTNDIRNQKDILNTEAGKRVLRAVLHIQRYIRRKRLNKHIPTIKLYLVTQKSAHYYSKVIASVRILQRHMLMVNLSSFLDVLSRAIILFKLSWKSTRILLPTVLRGPLPIAEVNSFTGLWAKLDSNLPFNTRFLASNLSSQRLDEGVYISIASAKYTIRNYEQLLVHVVHTFRTVYSGYLVRRTLAIMLAKASSYPHPGISHKQGIYYSARWMQYHPADVLRVLLNRHHSQENRNYVLTAYSEEYHSILSRVLLIQAFSRGLKQRLRMQVISVITRSAFDLDTSQDFIKGFYSSIIKETIRQLMTLESDTQKTLNKSLTMNSYMQAAISSIEGMRCKINKIQAAFRGCKLRTLLYRVRSACCSDFVLMRLAIANNFNYYSIVDAELIILQYMRAHHQRILLANAIKNAPDIVQALMRGNLTLSIRTVADFNSFQECVLRAALLLQSKTRMIITLRNIVTVKIITPLLFKFPMILDGLLLPTIIFREVMLKYIVETTIRLQSNARGYRVRMRLQLLYVVICEMLGNHSNNSQTKDVFLELRQLILCKLDLITSSPDQLLESADSLVKGAITIQAHVRGKRAYESYKKRALLAVSTIQKAIRYYLRSKLLALISKHKQLHKDVRLLATIGILDAELVQCILQDTSTPRSNDLKILQTVYETMLALQINLRGVIVRLRIKKLRELSETSCIFRMIWNLVRPRSQLPPPVPLSIELHTKFIYSCVHIQSIFRARSVRLRLQLLYQLVDELMKSNAVSDPQTEKITQKLILEASNKIDLKPDLIFKRFLLVTDSIQTLQHAFRQRAFLRNARLIKGTYLALPYLCHLPFYLVIQLFWNMSGNFLWMIRSARRSIATLRAINISLQIIHSCIANVLTLRMKNLCEQLQLDSVIASVLESTKITSTSILLRNYTKLLTAALIIQATYRGYKTRLLIRTYDSTLLMSIGTFDQPIKRLIMLLAPLSTLRVTPKDISLAASLLLNATLCIQRWYRGWRIRHSIDGIDKVILHTLLSRNALRTATICSQEQKSIIKHVVIIQRSAKLFLQAQGAKHIALINTLLKNDGTVDLIVYLSHDMGRKLLSNKHLLEKATFFKDKLEYIQAYARGFLSRQAIIVMSSLFAYFHLQDIHIALLLSLTRRACVLLFDKDCVLQCPSRIEPSVTWVSTSINILIKQILTIKSTYTIKTLSTVGLPVRYYMLEYVLKDNPDLIYQPKKFQTMLILTLSSVLMIQSAFRAYNMRNFLQATLNLSNYDTIFARILCRYILYHQSSTSFSSSSKPYSPTPSLNTIAKAENDIRKAVIIIQKAFLLRLRSNRVLRAQRIGFGYFLEHDLDTNLAFQKKERLLLQSAHTIQKAYREYAFWKTFRLYSNGDNLIMKLLLRKMHDIVLISSDSLSFDGTLPLRNMNLAYESLQLASLRIQKVSKGYLIRRACVLLQECKAAGLYPWVILLYLQIHNVTKFTLSRVIIGIASVQHYICIIQAYTRGYLHRSFTTQVSHYYLPFLTRQERLAGKTLIAYRCAAIDNAEKIIAAHIKAYLICKRLRCLCQHSAVPPPDKIHDILSKKNRFERYLKFVQATMNIQRYARGFLVTKSLSQAIQFCTQLYLPQSLMTVPSQCLLLTRIISDLTVRIQANVRGYLIHRSISYVRKHLDSKTFRLFFSYDNIQYFNKVLDRVRSFISSASLIAIKGRALLAKKTRAYIQGSGLTKLISITFEYSNYSKAVIQVKNLHHAIVMIQAFSRGFFVRNKIASISEILMQYNAVLDPILLYFIWIRTIPNHLNSIITSTGSYLNLVDSGDMYRYILSPFDAVALIAHSALIIQTYYRGYSIFKTAALCKKFGTNFTRNMSEDFYNNVSFIQAVIRGWNTRMVIKELDDFEHSILVSQQKYLTIKCPSDLIAFRKYLSMNAIIIEQSCRRFLISTQFKVFKHALGTIRHKATRRAFKSTLSPLTTYIIMKSATAEAARFSATLHIQANYRGNLERKSIASHTWRRILQIRERLAKSITHIDKTKTLGKQILIHKAILFKTDQPQNNPRSITKLNYFCNLYSPSMNYIFSREFADIVISVIENTITTPVLQQYNVFQDGCCLITKMLTYDPTKYHFNTLNLSNFNEMIKNVSIKSSKTPAKLLHYQSYTSTESRPPLMRLPDILINAIDFNRDNKEICRDAEVSLRTIIRCIKESEYDGSHFIYEHEKLTELYEAGVLQDNELIEHINEKNSEKHGQFPSLYQRRKDEPALLISTLRGDKEDN